MLPAHQSSHLLRSLAGDGNDSYPSLGWGFFWQGAFRGRPTIPMGVAVRKHPYPIARCAEAEASDPLNEITSGDRPNWLHIAVQHDDTRGVPFSVVALLTRDQARWRGLRIRAGVPYSAAILSF
jgi:hypothetical protein